MNQSFASDDQAIMIIGKIFIMLSGRYFADAGYMVESNREHGEGRSDIVISDLTNSKIIIFEAKYAKSVSTMEVRIAKRHWSKSIRVCMRQNMKMISDHYLLRDCVL